MTGSKKRFIYMVRTRIPGGRLTTDQFLAQMDLCDEVGNSTLRITLSPDAATPRSH